MDYFGSDDDGGSCCYWVELPLFKQIKQIQIFVFVICLNGFYPSFGSRAHPGAAERKCGAMYIHATRGLTGSVQQFID